MLRWWGYFYADLLHDVARFWRWSPQWLRLAMLFVAGFVTTVAVGLAVMD